MMTVMVLEFVAVCAGWFALGCVCGAWWQRLLPRDDGEAGE